MQGNNPKDQQTAKVSRRKFLMRAGLGSLPVLLTVKSRAAWGVTSGCTMGSQTASQAASVNPDAFQNCAGSMNSHGSAKLYFDPSKKPQNGDGKGAYFYQSTSSSSQSFAARSASAWNKTWNGIAINQNTLFSTIFDFKYGGTLEQALDKGPTSLIRNITSLFLHALFYKLENISTNIPTPDEIVNAYKGAKTHAQQEQLSRLLSYYIDGTPY